jgi:hypothetical protein
LRSDVDQESDHAGRIAIGVAEQGTAKVDVEVIAGPSSSADFAAELTLA